MGVLAINGVKILSSWLIERSANETQEHPDDVVVCLQ